MRVLVGDEAGFVRTASIEQQTVTQRWGEAVDRANYVDQVRLLDDVHDPLSRTAERYAAVARRVSGVIQLHDTRNGSIVCEWSDEEGHRLPEGTDPSRAHMNAPAFVGLEINRHHLLSANENGRVIFRSLDGVELLDPLPEGIDAESHTRPYESVGDMEIIFDGAGPNLCTMRGLQSDLTTFLTGGRNNDLKLWHLTPSGEVVSKWAAKNVRPDKFDLHVPIFVRDARFLDESGHKIATITGHSQVRVYDTRVQRRPVQDITLGELPLTSFDVTPDGSHAFIGNSIGIVTKLDMRKMVPCGTLKGFAGSVRSIECHRSLPYVACAGLDRFVHVHNTDTRKEVIKVYAMQRSTSVAFSKERVVAIKKKAGAKAGAKAAVAADDSDNEEEFLGSDEDEEPEQLASAEKAGTSTKRTRKPAAEVDEQDEDEEADDVWKAIPKKLKKTRAAAST
ncbi:hypothetical protein H696_01633 [Fonticula alba]|uniref:Ribosome biogenesis protein NSA1 n=1 Tax=Fonticula alba TaxID=691883 RepID=A0A058ZE83_FONAL|nr:hypothetical protein H696_01633 [Fonticula alba]KCV72233.1 hypothetical protein H696_01633 [Fonticula alba]|eukprot:XP_009493811.1 hypothetical protein H696_01633 [Fonticula alba]